MDRKIESEVQNTGPVLSVVDSTKDNVRVLFSAEAVVEVTAQIEIVEEEPKTSCENGVCVLNWKPRRAA